MIQLNFIADTPEQEARELREVIAPYSTIFERLDALEANVNTLNVDVDELTSTVEDMDNRIPTDTGWLDLTLNEGIESYSANQKPQYRKIGKIVFIRGAVTNIPERNTILATLPEGFRPVSVSNTYVQNTSLRTGDFAMIARLTINTSGVLKLEGISDGASYDDGKWFPITCSYPVE